jgi:hypothetical protein
MNIINKKKAFRNKQFSKTPTFTNKSIKIGLASSRYNNTNSNKNINVKNYYNIDKNLEVDN